MQASKLRGKALVSIRKEISLTYLNKTPGPTQPASETHYITSTQKMQSKAGSFPNSQATILSRFNLTQLQQSTTMQATKFSLDAGIQTKQHKYSLILVLFEFDFLVLNNKQQAILRTFFYSTKKERER